MHGLLRTVEVPDPHQASRLIWENLPAHARSLLNEREASSRQYEALDRRRFRVEPESFRSQFSFASFGAIRASRVADRRATQVSIRSPGVDAYCVSLVERGAARLVQPGWHEPVIANTETGVIFDSELRTRYAASDGSLRIILWISGPRLRERLEVLLDGQTVRSLSFQPVFDQTRGAGATIRHMLEFLFAELARSDSLLANQIAIRAFEDNIVLYLLLGLAHSHTRHLQQQRASAAPGAVKRAEEFMRANAGRPLTVAEIAQTAGCSVRALQAAFQHFRRTTPMTALRRIRLEEARTEILRGGRAESIARIAAGHGFGTPSRFAQLFRRTYGVYPSEALRTKDGGRITVKRS